jgi:hypothetical protein
MANGNGRAIALQNPSDLAKYRVNRPGQLEVLRQSLYDFQVYAAAGQAQLSFFQVPAGQAGKTKSDTNMTLAGQLPAGQQFLVQSIEIYFFPGTVFPGGVAGGPAIVDAFVNDVWEVRSGVCNLSFDVGSKNYLTETPLMRFPPKTRLDGFAAQSDSAVAAATTFMRTSYADATGRPYPVDPYILLESTQNFGITINWPALIAITNAGRIGCVLDGLLVRNSQ